MATFADILSLSTRKTILVTGCDMYGGFQLARTMLQQKGKYFEHVYAVYFEENLLVKELKKLGACCIRLAIADGADPVVEAYSKADVVVVVPPVSDEQWGEDACVFVLAAEKAKVKGLALCSKVGVDKMSEFKMLEPLIKMEQAYNKVKGNFKAASLVRCSLHIDVLWLFRRQIALEHTISLPARSDAKFAPLAEGDGAQVLYNMLMDPKFPTGTYELTGAEQVDFKTIAHNAASMLDNSIRYKQVGRHEMEEYLKQQGDVCENFIGFVSDILEAVSKGLVEKCSGDLEKLLGKQPVSVKKYLERNADSFKP
ncbi:NAD(P)-binding protein [Coemansia reversa NRRL 1564]|uniref:NAD(P)-binding protein n=1 Tax=Coemansia reversa (strain ATCC 12441 / NRRL 1564) TaxID=763665 RepID=A0A2G5BFM3_COERN|nr:NAD(P)-binding protein [Coemansia reversa NRRL 1564]|eukprot:PIA17517.1 NAD(P)-binding protein [Coemansia reversa NRRL 1564]